jgi:hypothetical protein
MTLFAHADTIAAHPGPADTTFPAADAQHYGVKIARFWADDSATRVVALTHDVHRAIAAANRWWREDEAGENAHEISIEWAGWWQITRACQECEVDASHRCTWWTHPNDWSRTQAKHSWRYEPCDPGAENAFPVIELAVL